MTDHEVASLVDLLRNQQAELDRAHDALQLKEAELQAKTAEVAALNRELEETNAGLIVLHSELTQRGEELAAAKAVAEEATRARSAFLATMGHEIRTPMTAIAGFTSLLLGTELDAEQLDYATTIRSSCDHLLAIMNQVLDFSKVEAGGVQLESVPFGLRACVEESLGLVAEAAARKGVSLSHQAEDGVPAELVGDPARVRQVLINLLSNAVKFTEDGEVVVRVRPEPARAGEVRVSVHDTGIGIAEDQLPLVFREFHQADASTSRVYGGTGLGLAICQRLVELMGGRIWVESAVGEGSVFSFTLPLGSG